MTVGFVVLMVVLVAGCSSGGGSSEPGLIEAWRLRSITPIGQPVAVSDTVVVVHGTENQDLYLYGVAVADGTLRWRQPASPGAVVPGIAVQPNVIDGRVAYFRPDPSANLAARLVVASPQDGSDQLVSDPNIFRSHPKPCSDGKDVRPPSAIPRCRSRGHRVS